MIGDRIKSVKERLEKVKRQRGTQRKARERRGTFRVSLVGYTNAGKSTLFNALVKARAYAADQLFATLDTTTRRCGWSRRLFGVAVRHRRIHPRPAAQAGRSLRGHAAGSGRCRPAAARDRQFQPVRSSSKAEVERVLAEIGADAVPQILVCNKCDLLEATRSPAIGRTGSKCTRACAGRACSSARSPAKGSRICAGSSRSVRRA
jgi:GTP-binding protein HflX